MVLEFMHENRKEKASRFSDISKIFDLLVMRIYIIRA